MVGTLEAVLADKRRPQAEELTDIERRQIGTFIRLEIPLTDIYKLRKVANLLRGAAERIDHRTRRTDLSIKDILIGLKYDLGSVGYQIKRMFPEVFQRRFYSHGPQETCDTSNGAESTD